MTKNNNLKINICKTDDIVTNEFKKKFKNQLNFHKKNSFDSVFKFNLLKKLKN